MKYSYFCKGFLTYLFLQIDKHNPTQSGPEHCLEISVTDHQNYGSGSKRSEAELMQ